MACPTKSCAKCGREAALSISRRTGVVWLPACGGRVSGQPVIARDTALNREIAGPALCNYTLGDSDSLRQAVQVALTAKVAPDPGPFDPDRYFGWMLGPPR